MDFESPALGIGSTGNPDMMNEGQKERMKMEMRDLAAQNQGLAARNKEFALQLTDLQDEIMRHREIADEMMNRAGA